MLNSITFVYVCDLWCEHCTPYLPVCFAMDDSVVNWSGSFGDIINCIGPSYACNSRPLLIRMPGDIAPAVAVVEPDIGRSNCMSLACTMPGAARFCLIYVSMSWRYNAQKMKMNRTKFINLRMFDLGYQSGWSKLIFKVSRHFRMPLCYGLMSFCREFICKVHRTCNRYSSQSLVERTKTQNQQKTTNGFQFHFISHANSFVVTRVLPWKKDETKLHSLHHQWMAECNSISRVVCLCVYVVAYKWTEQSEHTRTHPHEYQGSGHAIRSMWNDVITPVRTSFYQFMIFHIW